MKGFQSKKTIRISPIISSKVKLQIFRIRCFPGLFWVVIGTGSVKQQKKLENLFRRQDLYISLTRLKYRRIFTKNAKILYKRNFRKLW